MKENNQISFSDILLNIERQKNAPFSQDLFDELSKKLIIAKNNFLKKPYINELKTYKSEINNFFVFVMTNCYEVNVKLVLDNFHEKEIIERTFVKAKNEDIRIKAKEIIKEHIINMKKYLKNDELKGILLDIKH